MLEPTKYAVDRTIEYFIDSCTKSDTARMALEVYPEDIEVIKDRSYIDDGSLYHNYDIYVPKAHLDEFNDKSSEYGRKAVLDIHGGGFVYGLKEINKNCNMTVASLGDLPVYSINYELCPAVSIVHMLNEICTAIKYFRDNEGVEELFIMGDSAGGYLAMTTWALIVDEKIRNEFKCRVNPDVKVNGLILICPAARDDSRFIEGIEVSYFKDDESNLVPPYGRKLGEIINQTNKPLPPSVLITSDKDFLHDETLYLADKMKERNGEVVVFDGVTKENGNELTHVYVVGHPEWEESEIPLQYITSLIRR